MSATRDERLSAEFTRDNVDTRATELGHVMTWELAPNSRRRGHCYHFQGACTNCGAEATAGAAWSSCGGVRDARREPCSGPGTTVLTDIETGRVHDLAAGAVADFGRQVAAANLTARTEHTGDALRWIITGPSGEMELRITVTYAAIIYPPNPEDDGDRDCEITQGEELTLLWRAAGEDDTVIWADLQRRYQIEIA